MIMERLEILLELFDEALSTKKRRYVVGGILMSVSLFFSGLSITVLIINKEEKERIL
jgi:hypothetical protein